MSPPARPRMSPDRPHPDSKRTSDWRQPPSPPKLQPAEIDGECAAQRSTERGPAKSRRAGPCRLTTPQRGEPGVPEAQNEALRRLSPRPPVRRSRHGLAPTRQLGEALSGAGLRCRPSKPGRSRDQRERRPENGRPRRCARRKFLLVIGKKRVVSCQPRPRLALHESAPVPVFRVRRIWQQSCYLDCRKRLK